MSDMSQTWPWTIPLNDEVTLVEGSSFCVSDRAGDIAAHRAQGMFFQDTRILSVWRLSVDDMPLESLAVVPGEPFTNMFVTRAAPRLGHHDATLLVQRSRMVAAGMREDVVIRNYGQEAAGCRVVLAVEGDFADLFDVKEGRVTEHPEIERHVATDELELTLRYGGRHRGVSVRGAGAIASPGALTWHVSVPARGEWRTSILVQPLVDGIEVAPSFPLDRPVDEAVPSRRLARWRAASPRVECSEPIIEHTLSNSQDDLGSLRIPDPDRPGVEVVAAGAPWFMATFGRDSIISSWMALPFEPSLALGTLQTLAALQGTKVDVMSEEEPGRILHEVRRGVDESRALGGSKVYYGSIDSTPLFVMLLDEVARWGAEWKEVEALLPAADAAIHWIEEYGDRDGDGFVEYQRTTDRGLINQGWKDSGDAINFADGRRGIPPIALCEVQAYVYGAYRARAHLAKLASDPDRAAECTDKAERLRTAFHDAFWLPDKGYPALALDRNKVPVDSLASNIGHCLWTGILHAEEATSVAEHLVSPALFSGWGIRTLATTMETFNPVSYHNGSVWPHDNALIVAGLMRYGYVEAAQKVATGLMAAAAAFGGRLPELFCGFDRRDVPRPVVYPSSCNPQAWAAATPMSLVRTLLRLDVCIPEGMIMAANTLPTSWGEIRLLGLPLAGSRITLDTRAPELVTGELPAGLRRAAGAWPLHSDRE